MREASGASDNAGSAGLVARKVTEWVRPHEGLQMLEGVFADQKSTESEYDQRECFRMIPDSLLRRNVYPSWYRHFGFTNVLFIDVHVANQTPRQLGQAMKYHVQVRALSSPP